ncbi:MAG: hypothetical protein AB8B96_17590, partial [Lysobacterales bacterium]
EIFNDYPNQPSDEELDEKYTVLETFVFPEGRGFLVQVNGSYEFPEAMPSLMSAQSKYHQDQTDVAIAKVEELVATLDYELRDRALVMVGNFTGDKLPDVMIQLNVPVESGELTEHGTPMMETVWFANVPTTELPPRLPRNLSDSVADPAYRIANDYQTYPDFRTKN